jgi:nucleotide-binding universal stress UspA family protein
MFTNALVGVDARMAGRDAIALACQLLDADGRMTLAHVHRGDTTNEREDSRELLKAARLAAGVDAEIVSVVAESPGRGLHEQAERQSADLLVAGSCSRGVWGRIALGDDARAALNGAPCAVAVAPLGFAEHHTVITKVGVAFNGSSESVAALAVAQQLAAATHATVHALEVVALPSMAYAGLLPPSVGDTIESMLEEANARMDALPDVEGQAVYGLASEKLVAFGDEVDILLVGSRGYGPMRRLVVGSTSDYLERHARCPLLILPPSHRGQVSDGNHRQAVTAGTLR